MQLEGTNLSSPSVRNEIQTRIHANWKKGRNKNNKPSVIKR